MSKSAVVSEKKTTNSWIFSIDYIVIWPKIYLLVS